MIIFFIFYIYIYGVCNYKIYRNISFLFFKIVKKLYLNFFYQNNNKFKIMEYKKK